MAKPKPTPMMIIPILIAVIAGIFTMAAILMVSYNYIGPTISCLFTGKIKQESETDFVKIDYWESLVLIIVSSILFKGGSMCTNC